MEVPTEMIKSVVEDALLSILTRDTQYTKFILRQLKCNLGDNYSNLNVIISNVLKNVLQDKRLDLNDFSDSESVDSITKKHLDKHIDDSVYIIIETVKKND